MSFSKKGKWYPRKDSYIPSAARAGMSKARRRKNPISDSPDTEVVSADWKLDRDYRNEFNQHQRKIKQRLERLELMLQMKRDGVL